MAKENLEVLITADDRASGVLGGLHGLLGGIGNVAMGVFAAGIAAAGAALVGLGAALASSVNEAIEAQNVLAQLDAVLKSTESVAGVTREQVVDLASSLQLVTRFSDEAIIGGENLLLTFTNISEDIFPQATEIMLDMSQALGQDLKSSAIQLGKALQDPILGITALRRVGVNFNEADKEMIKGMVEAGHLQEAQIFILKELQKEFGGSAEAAGKTFAGKLDILKNRLSDIKEELGLKVIPILERFTDKVIVPLIPHIEKAATIFGGVLETLAESKEVQSFIDRLSTGLVNLTNTLSNLMLGRFDLSALIPDFSALIPDMPVINIPTSVNIDPLDTLLNWLTEHAPDIQENAKKIGDSLLEAGKSIGTAIAPTAMDAWNIFSNWLKENDPLIRKFGDTISNFIAKEALPALSSAFQTFWSIVEPILLGYEQSILNVIKALMQLVTGDWKGAWESFVQSQKDIVGAKATAVDIAGNAILGGLNIPASEHFTRSELMAVTINYSPALSTASQADVERIMPLIEEGVSRVLRNKR